MVDNVKTPEYSADVTPARDPNAPTTFAVVPDDLLTEQEKDVAGGVGPASPSEGSPGPVETMEDLGIGPRMPYPEGNPPPPSAADLANIEAAKNAPAAKKEPRPKAEPLPHPAPDPFGTKGDK